MSLTKPDSLSEGNPYAYGSKGALLFQRAFFLVLLLVLSGVFFYKLAIVRETRIDPEILVLRFADSTPDLNLGVPFQQADLDLIHNTLEIKPEQALIASRDAFRDRLRELRRQNRSAAIIYLKGYGYSTSNDTAAAAMETEQSPAHEGELSAPNERSKSQPASPSDHEGGGPQYGSGVFVRLNGEKIPASEIIDTAFEVDDKPNRPPEIATRLLVLDCSQAVSNFRIGMFSNVFPAKIAKALQESSNPKPQDHWVLLPCGVNQLSYPSPDMKNTAFAKAFAEGLKGRADNLDEGGNGNGVVELKELYDYVCSVCAFESQLPLLLNGHGVAVTPFDDSKSEDRGPVLAVVRPENAVDPGASGANDAEPRIDPNQSNPSEPKMESATPKTAQNTGSAGGNSSPPERIITMSTGLSSLHHGPQRRPWFSFVRSSLLLTNQESNAPPAGNSDAIGPKGKESPAELDKQQKPTTTGTALPRNPEDDEAKTSPGAKAAEQAPDTDVPKGQNLDPWDSMRAQLLQNLQTHRNARLDFVAVRLQMAEFAEKDFRQRFLAGDLNALSSGPVSVQLGNGEDPNASEREDLIRAKARAASTGKTAALENSVLAWDAILETRFELPSFVEWHDHLSILDPVGAAELRELVTRLSNELERLEAEILKFETPSVLDEGALEEKTEKTKQALIALRQYVSISLQDAAPELLYSVLRTSLLTGQERNDVVDRLGTTLKDRKKEHPGGSVFQIALKDQKAEQQLAAVSELRLRLDNFSRSETTETSEENSSAEHLRELTPGAKTKDVVSWLRLASTLPLAQCRTPHATPRLPLPFFPLEPKLQLILSESDAAQKRLVPKEKRSLRFTLSLSDLEESERTTEIRTDIRFAVEPPNLIDLKIRSASLDERQIEPDSSYPFTLDSSGQLQFELLAEAADYFQRPSQGTTLPAVSLRVFATTRIRETNLSAEVPARLLLPVKELIALEVDGDPRIPQSAGSHNRSLRILPNTVTLNRLKLRNRTLSARTVRVDVYAIKELPTANWPPGLLYASDPSPQSEPRLFSQLESVLQDKSGEARLRGPLVAQSGPLPLHVALTDSESAIPIPFITPAAAQSVATAAQPATNQPQASSRPDVSHGLLLNVVDLKETKNGDNIVWVDGNESWRYWLEVNPLHPRALFDASAEWNHSRKEVQVRVTRKLPDDAGVATEASQKTTVRFTLADHHGWPITPSDTRSLTADGYTFPNVEASEDPHRIFVDIDGYPRALVIDLECRNERDTIGSLNNDWNNARFTYFGSPGDGMFVRRREGFALTRKDAKSPLQRIFETPFFSAKAAENESKSRPGISVGLQIDGGVRTDRRPNSIEKSDTLSPMLKGVVELESLRFPRDRHHQVQLSAAKDDGTLAITSTVADWQTEWIPTTGGGLVELKIGLFESAGTSPQEPDSASVLIDGNPPEFRLTPLALSVQEDGEGILEIQQRDQNPSAPVERIEFNIVTADEPEQAFSEDAVVKNLTVSWPTGKTQQIRIVPAKLKLSPGKYLIRARTTDALGQQNSDVLPVNLDIRKKPDPKPEMKNDAPKKGFVRLRFLYKGMPLKQFANYPKLEVTVYSETKDKDSAVDGVIEFSKEAELDKPVDAFVKWTLRRGTAIKTTTIKVAPVSKDGDHPISIEELEAEAAKK